MRFAIRKAVVCCRLFVRVYPTALTSEVHVQSNLCGNLLHRFLAANRLAIHVVSCAWYTGLRILQITLFVQTCHFQRIYWWFLLIFMITLMLCNKIQLFNSSAHVCLFVCSTSTSIGIIRLCILTNVCVNVHNIISNCPLYTDIHLFKHIQDLIMLNMFIVACVRVSIKQLNAFLVLSAKRLYSVL